VAQLRVGIGAAGLLLGVVLLLGLAVTGPFRWMTDAFLFHPEAGQHRDPSALGLSFTERWLVTADGVRIQAWWMPRATPADGPGVSIVTFHGNGGTMADRLEWCFLVHQLGVSVLAVEYRGYGDSEGTPSEEGLAQDARAGLVEARRLAAESGDRVVVHGRSLGGAVAIRLAGDEEVAGLIAESTFTSLAAMAKRTGIPLAGQLVAYYFDSESSIAQVGAPVLLVHGDADEVVPFWMGERLRDVAQAAELDVSFLPVPAGQHNSTWTQAGDAYVSLLRSWLQQVGPLADQEPEPSAETAD